MVVSADDFKRALARFASGVTVVMTNGESQPLGATVSSFTSVSLSPPLVLICLQRRLRVHDAIQHRKAFSVSILNGDQIELGKRFAGLLPHITDRMAGVPTDIARTGCPIVRDCIAWVDCQLWETYAGGDHTIFIGEVLAASNTLDGSPLLYYDRQWHRGEAPHAPSVSANGSSAPARERASRARDQQRVAVVPYGD